MTQKGYLKPGFRSTQDPKNNFFNEGGASLRLARVINVDHENMTVDVLYLDGIGSALRVPVGQAYAGSRSFLGAMPSVQDICIVGFNLTSSLTNPVILTFYPFSYSSALKNDILNPSSELFETIRPKMKKIYEGEIFLSSKQGSDIHLDKDIILSNSGLNEINIKSADNSIHFNSINTYLTNTGFRSVSGPIHRNELINDPNFKFPNSQFPIYYNSEGVPYYTPNLTRTINSSFPYGKETVDDDNPAFIEHRLEIKEYDDLAVPVTTSNSGIDIDSFYTQRVDGSSNNPLVVQVFGTLVGNDPVGEKEKYGVILKPILFSDAKSLRATPQELPCTVESGINETTSLAAAYTLKFPNSGTSFYVNKQGKYFANIASSTNLDPLGAGESAEVNLQGHAKFFIGKNTELNRSLTLNTDGGVFTNWGFDKDKNRSWDATFRKGVSWNILGADKDGLSFHIRMVGDYRDTVDGSKYTEIKGSENKLVKGSLEEKILGKKVGQYVSDVNNTYGGRKVDVFIGDCNQTFTQGISRTIIGPNITFGETNAESTQIKFGNSDHKIFLGNKKEEIIIGNHTSKINLGNKSININVGNYSVSCKLGNIDIKTSFGTINVKTNGQVNIEGKLGVNIKSALQVKVEAPLVNIGKNKPLQGIVTGGPAGHKDYITGLPLIGSVTCKASAR
jgi:hypothetical protein